MIKQYGYFSNIGIPTHAEAAEHLYGTAQKRLEQHHGQQVVGRLGATCLLAGRLTGGLPMVHGFVLDAASRTLVVESHYASEHDKDNSTPAHRRCFMGPDEACENITLSPDAISYTQLNSGKPFPPMFRDDAYYLLDNRLRRLDPNYKTKRGLITYPHTVESLVTRLLVRHKHSFQHPVLQALSEEMVLRTLSLHRVSAQ